MEGWGWGASLGSIFLQILGGCFETQDYRQGQFSEANFREEGQALRAGGRQSWPEVAMENDKYSDGLATLPRTHQ